ncbi:MAG: hypothetical protein EHM41_00040 [Chloroflexi bacterium]|nr:MAG: hypothetical protein EHM41_00040 [Chloroflexota bacterium]
MAYGMLTKSNTEDDTEDVAASESGVYYVPPTEKATTAIPTTTDPLADNYTYQLWKGTSSGGSSGASTAATPTGQTTVSGTKYSGTAPTLGDIPDYKAPEEWSGEKMAGEVQKKSALGLRQARQMLREATAGLGTDPAGRLALKNALAQHGINIQGTMAQAEAAAETSEANELARKTNEAQVKYQAETTYLYQTYQAAWNKYISTGEQYSTTKQDYADGTDASGTSTKSYFKTLGYSSEDLEGAVA